MGISLFDWETNQMCLGGGQVSEPGGGHSPRCEWTSPGGASSLLRLRLKVDKGETSEEFKTDIYFYLGPVHKRSNTNIL